MKPAAWFEWHVLNCHLLLFLSFFKFFFSSNCGSELLYDACQCEERVIWNPLKCLNCPKNIFLPSFFIPPLSFLSVHTLLSVSVWTEVCVDTSLSYMKPPSNDPQWDQSVLRKHSEGVFGLLSLAMIHKAFSIINEPRLALGLSTGSRILTDIMLEWS